MRSLTTLAAELRSGSVSARDLVEEALDAAQTRGNQAYRALRSTSARVEADLVDRAFVLGRDLGPLAGLPISVKDLYGLDGEQTFAGTPRALPPRFERTGSLLERAARQVGVIVGKTHTVELAFGGIGTNAHWGTPRNPCASDGRRVPGGSSSGAGVSLREGSAVLAFGTDTAGSVRIPAAWTGTVGLKTTKGRWPTDGIVPLSTTLDTPGILARTVEELAFAFHALDRVGVTVSQIAGLAEPRDAAGLRLGVATGLFREDCSPGVWEAVETAVLALEEAGARVEDVELAGVEQAKAVFDLGGPTAIELHSFLSLELPDWLETLDPAVRDRLRSAAETPAGEYLRRLAEMRRAHATAMAGLEGFDAILTPTVANTPPLVEDLEDLDRYRRENLLALRNTAMVSTLGLCAVSLPCGVDAAGMPVGLQLIGPANGETGLLAVAGGVERAIG